MRNEPISGAYRACHAMIDAGITDPNSQEGIDFCVYHCPYEGGCIVMDGKSKQDSASPRKAANRDKVWALWQLRTPIKDIARMLGVHERTVYRYIQTKEKSL